MAAPPLPSRRSAGRASPSAVRRVPFVQGRCRTEEPDEPLRGGPVGGNGPAEHQVQQVRELVGHQLVARGLLGGGGVLHRPFMTRMRAPVSASIIVRTAAPVPGRAEKWSGDGVTTP
jgi:hypothetical protein